MRISDWSSDVCSSGSMPPLMLPAPASGRRGRFGELQEVVQQRVALLRGDALRMELHAVDRQGPVLQAHDHAVVGGRRDLQPVVGEGRRIDGERVVARGGERRGQAGEDAAALRSEEHTSELQSLMRLSYAVLCLK